MAEQQIKRLKAMEKNFLLAVFAGAVLVAALFFLTQPVKADNANDNNSGAGQMAGNTRVLLETSMGNITIRLFDGNAPVTAANFKKLVQQGFYNGTIFHRVIADFMIQGGDPTGTGTGGPGYTIKDEFSSALKHSKAGILSMANTGQPNTGGSQFFITLAPTPWLDGKHAVFGEVIGGMDIVEAIGKVQTNANDRPLKDVVIEKATIVG